MPHQCTRCGKVYSDASEEILKGCGCGSNFFYYIKQERLDELKKEIRETIVELDKSDKEQIEKDIRELTGLDKEPEKPVILDLESVRVIKPGKFEIDLVNLFAKNRPLIYKLEEGKYIIDLSPLKREKGFVERKSFLDEIEEDEDKLKENKVSEQEVKEEVAQQTNEERGKL